MLCRLSPCIMIVSELRNNVSWAVWRSGAKTLGSSGPRSAQQAPAFLWRCPIFCGQSRHGSLSTVWRPVGPMHAFGHFVCAADLAAWPMLRNMFYRGPGAWQSCGRCFAHVGDHQPGGGCERRGGPQHRLELRMSKGLLPGARPRDLPPTIAVPPDDRARPLRNQRGGGIQDAAFNIYDNRKQNGASCGHSAAAIAAASNPRSRGSTPRPIGPRQAPRRRTRDAGARPPWKGTARSGDANPHVLGGTAGSATRQPTSLRSPA